MNALRAAGWIARVGCMVHLCKENVVEVQSASGPSMLPTFNVTGEFFLISKVGLNDIAVGDVVTAVHPHDPVERIAKRVIGLAGDVVCVDPTLPSAQQRWIKVPQGHAWLCGDNLAHSLDSREWGPLPLALVRGKIVAKVWPEYVALKNPMKNA